MSTEQYFKTIEDRLERIERITLVAAKPVLELSDAALFTGLSVGHLYRLTSCRRIPHYKRSRKLYFNKKELEEWMLENRVKTEEEIDSDAMTFCATKNKHRNSNA